VLLRRDKEIEDSQIRQACKWRYRFSRTQTEPASGNVHAGRAMAARKKGTITPTGEKAETFPSGLG